GGIGTMTTAAVFLVIYPMMVNLRVEALVQAGRNVRGLLLALVYNFVWAPLIGFVLVRLFLHDPLLALGFLLVMVVPCSSSTPANSASARVALARVWSSPADCMACSVGEWVCTTRRCAPSASTRGLVVRPPKRSASTMVCRRAGTASSLAWS
ncbi:MAG TPA: bile acid:sodium symporter, partial [Kineosporiaceae bacterium]|nr:bile acid:sodium symporter [Kineosporiaceae bacterium]